VTLRSGQKYLADEQLDYKNKTLRFGLQNHGTSHVFFAFLSGLGGIDSKIRILSHPTIFI
jgi:hypothetical protein